MKTNSCKFSHSSWPQIERVFWFVILTVSFAVSGIVVNNMYQDWSSNPGETTTVPNYHNVFGCSNFDLRAVNQKCIQLFAVTHCYIFAADCNQYERGLRLVTFLFFPIVVQITFETTGQTIQHLQFPAVTICSDMFDEIGFVQKYVIYKSLSNVLTKQLNSRLI